MVTSWVTYSKQYQNKYLKNGLYFIQLNYVNKIRLESPDSGLKENRILNWDTQIYTTLAVSRPE